MAVQDLVGDQPGHGDIGDDRAVEEEPGPQGDAHRDADDDDGDDDGPGDRVDPRG
jgi:hypothetical protein